MSGVDVDQVTVYNDTRAGFDGSNFTVRGDSAAVELYQYEPRSIFTSKDVNIRYDAELDDNDTANFTHTGLPSTMIEFRVDGNKISQSQTGRISGEITDGETREIQVSDFLEPNVISGFLQGMFDFFRGFFNLDSFTGDQQIALGIMMVLGGGAAAAVFAGGMAGIAVMLVTVLILPVAGLWPDWLTVLLLVLVGVAALLFTS